MVWHCFEHLFLCISFSYSATPDTSGTPGDFRSVVSGLKPGERIVSTGLFKLRPGMPVVENNTLTPKSESAPTPADS